MLNKKNIVYYDKAAVKRSLKSYEPLFAAKLKRDVALTIELSLKGSDNQLYFFSLKDLDNQPTEEVIAKCNLHIAEAPKNKALIYKIPQMATDADYQKQGLQKLLQAVLYDIFAIEEVQFNNTCLNGENYIKGNPLLEIQRGISYDGEAPDFFCQVDLAQCREMLGEFKK